MSMAGAEASEALIEALPESDSLTKRRLCLILGKSEDQRAVPPLRKALSDRDWNIRNAAARALCKKIGRRLKR